MRGRVCLVAVLAGLGILPAAAVAQSDTSRLIVSLALANTRNHRFQNQLLVNCNLFFVGGLAVEGNPQRATAAGAPSGSIDFANGRGEAFVSRSSWQVQALPPSHARPTYLNALGVALQGRKLFLTGRITHGRSLIARAGRARLAVVSAAKRDDGTLQTLKGKPVPNTFSYIAEGKLRMLPALSRALERTRCKGRRNRGSHRLKPGYVLGELTVGMRPDHASGLAGNVQFQPHVSTPDGDPVAVEPGAGVAEGSRHVLTAPITSGLPVPLACLEGDECVPSGGSLVLGGGFDLVFGGRRTSVAGITYSTTGASRDLLTQSITGTLDGAPVVIAGGRPPSFALTDDFIARAGAALGTDITGELDMLPLLTRTGP
jgi:hypothetical protein